MNNDRIIKLLLTTNDYLKQKLLVVGKVDNGSNVSNGIALII